jgi:hypothetical protein
VRKILLNILIFTTSLVFAQDETKLGFQFGTNFSNIRGNKEADKSTTGTNFLIGFSVEEKVYNKVHFFANINYERKSIISEAFSYDFFDPVIGSKIIDVKTTFQYITLPVMAKIFLDRKNKIFVNLGIFGGYLLAVSENTNNSLKKSDFNDFDAGLNIGIGTTFSVNKNSNLNLWLQDNYGLVNISNVPVVDNGTIKTNSISLVLNLDFKL